jgi:hypothetical protein
MNYYAFTENFSTYILETYTGGFKQQNWGSVHIKLPQD